jgi:hypothetical protein
VGLPRRRRGGNFPRNWHPSGTLEGGGGGRPVVDETVWRWVCGVADRSRARRVPLPGLADSRTSPVSGADCLDPRSVDDPSRLYPPPPPVKPYVWEMIDRTDGVELEALTFASAAAFGIAPNDRVTVNFYRSAARPPLFSLLILHGIWRQDQEFEDKLCRALARPSPRELRVDLAALPLGAGPGGGAQRCRAELALPRRPAVRSVPATRPRPSGPSPDPEVFRAARRRPARPASRYRAPRRG